MRCKYYFITGCLLAVAVCGASAFTGISCRPGTVFGQVLQYVVKEDESLVEIARNFDLGFNEITAANPLADPFVPSVGSYVQIPLNRIIPDLPKPVGIVINIPEMRLYYFPKQPGKEALTFPVGIGDRGKESPLGIYTITAKINNPSWHVPTSIRQEAPYLPKVVPPGPDNPMGNHALRLSGSRILIHGTNRPYSIGRRASHGCIRLYPEDMARLFQLVPVHTKVTVINQPVKVAEIEGKVYVEVHGEKEADLLKPAMRILKAEKFLRKTDTELLKKAVREKSGLIVNISLCPSS